MKFQNIQVMNFTNAFRGLRNPMNSWTKSDSWGGIVTLEEDDHLEDIAKHWMYNQSEEYNEVILEKYLAWLYTQGLLQKNGDAIDVFYIGPKDLDLAQRMIRAGSSDRKFLRQILVSIDLTAPLYFWKQFDTYKIGTVANSTSTMHKLSSTPINQDCFELDDFKGELNLEDGIPTTPYEEVNTIWYGLIHDLEKLRKLYNKTKDKRYWKELIRLLPEGWLQTRTVTMNYEVLRNIYSQRKTHKLSEWHTFCEKVKNLPYGYELITFDLD